MFSRSNKIFIALCVAILICSGCQVIHVSASTWEYEDLEKHQIETHEPKQSGDFLYQYCDVCQGIAIVDYIGKDKVVIVPDTIDGIQVKELANGALQCIDTMEECILPDGIRSLGSRCFVYCRNLEKVNIPEGVTFLNTTFLGCYSLKEVSLPSTLVEIGASAFDGCKSLKNIDIPDGVQSIGTKAFLDCVNLQTVKLPSELKVIGKRAFRECENLREIEIPDSVMYIDDEAFLRCSALRKVTLSKNLFNLGYKAFAKCPLLKEITFPASLRTIGSKAFFNCKRLKEITFEGKSVPWVGSQAFRGIQKNAVIHVPKKSVSRYKRIMDKTTGYQSSTMKIK